MIVAGAGPNERPGCYLVVGSPTHLQSERPKEAVRGDELGVKATRILGKRMGKLVR